MTNRKRNNPIQIYLNDDELNKLEDKIQEFNFDDKSSFIRKAILDYIYIPNERGPYTQQFDIIIERLYSIARIINLKNRILSEDEFKNIKLELKKIDKDTYKLLENLKGNIKNENL